MRDTPTDPLSPELRRELARLCERENRSASEVAREAIRRYIAIEDFRALRQKLRPHAPANGSLTDDDFFGAIS